ncbi:hypothetical protein DFH94DRAFT_821701 [Russula ochroleuca]|uniref:Transmembrane protein n=1 Tax=Russula ochroleuca TaxID=152965 RepID=A0A9P5MNM6_9AGAM|nr:hypothetical protein DFH94DRAFT_821701 [Russula ochroleuca]
MSLPLVAAPLASFFFFLFAFAKISAPSCTSSTWKWSFNTLGQSPCTVTAYMMGTCNGGEYPLPPLDSGGLYFDHNPIIFLCECTTVGYSLFSACAACQGGSCWQEWANQCAATLPPSEFPNLVPSGVRVPQWALIDVTTENNWDPNTSYAVGDSPELGPGSVIGPAAVSVHPTSSSTGLPISGGGSSKGGAIAGGIIGAVAAITIVIAAVFYLRRRSQAPSAVVGTSHPLRPMSIEGAPSPTATKFYDPSDPTTFPGHSQDIPYQGPMSSYIGTGSTPGNTQTSLPPARGYDGRPIL